jgi:hypothetical protein
MRWGQLTLVFGVLGLLGGALGAIAHEGFLVARVAFAQPEDFFVTQFEDRRFNHGPTVAHNANCGPTSLAMAMRLFGVAPREMAVPEHAQALIRRARYLMTGEVDELIWTFPLQVQDGALRAGLEARVVREWEPVRDAMALPGRAMILNLNPTPAYAHLLRHRFNGGHFALLVRLTEAEALLCDPLASGPLRLSPETLRAALGTPLGKDPNGKMRGAFNGGILLWRH